MATPQQPNAQQNARLQQIRRQWEQKRQITDRFASIRTTVGVYSGKGGVGKTTVACNLATTLAAQGERVGLLDVDIDCPNVARVMGIVDKPDYTDGKITLPWVTASRSYPWRSSRKTRTKPSSGADP